MSSSARATARSSRRSRMAVWREQVVWALRASVQRLAGRPFGSVLTMLVLGVALALPLALWLLLGNAQSMLGTLGDSRALSVFMQPTGDKAEAQTMATQLGQRQDVLAVALKSPQQGMAELAAMQGFGDALESLSYNPLPWVLLVQPAQHGDGGVVNELATYLRSLPGVDMVQDDAAWRERMQALLALGTRGFQLLAGLLVLALLLVVGQTVRQDIRSRAEEIAVLQLAGASARFVRRPYLYAGAWYGLGAGVVAVLLVLLVELFLHDPAVRLLTSYGGHLHLQGLPLRLLLLVPLLGMALGWLGARAVSSHHLSR